MPKRSAPTKRIKTSKLRKKSIISGKLKKVILSTIVFLIAVLFLSGYFFYKKITTQLASALGNSSSDLLSESVIALTVIEVEDLTKEPLIADNIKVNLFDKDTSKLIIYNIPVQIEIDIPGRFGVEPLSNVLALAEMDLMDANKSGLLAAKTLTKLIAFPIDRYLIIDDSMNMASDWLLTGCISADISEISYEKIRDHIKTNLSVNEIIDLYKFSNSLPEDRIVTRNLSGEYLENQTALDEEFMDITFDMPMSKENKSISILNGTKISGAANYEARIIRNYGGRVVAVGNTSEMQDKSVIIVDDLNSQTVRILNHIFEIDTIILKTQAQNYQESEIDRSDITIIVGLDFAREL